MRARSSSSTSSPSPTTARVCSTRAILYTTLDEQAGLTSKTGLPVPFGLCFIDLDHFKTINDTHGHLVGSRLLAEVGDLIRRVIGPDDMAFRYGGDEFVVLMPSTNKPAAMVLIDRLCEVLRSEAFLGGQNLTLTVSGSFGLAVFPEDGATVQAILRAADSMMYAVKNSTRDDVAIAGRPRLVRSPKSIQSERRSAIRR